ncbi:hypothetical protein VCSRO137_3587 [Vibrio cholerae]|nr:hypothetical protein VCSRO137_3587 [Vibrio cholerae]
MPTKLKQNNRNLKYTYLNLKCLALAVLLKAFVMMT